MESHEWMMVLMILAFSLVFGLAIVDMVIYEDSAVTGDDVYLRSLQDGSSIRGSFSLGSGYVREKPQFVYYAIDGNGYVLRSVPADVSKIIEDENTKPYLRTYMTMRKGYISAPFYYDYRYEFHVPKDTVIQQWNLDGQLR